MNQSPIRATGIAWFRPEDYDRCRQLFSDGHGLNKRYQDWHQAAQGLYERLTRSGHIVEKVYIDPETFPAWCAERGLNVDAQARMRFANEFVYRKYANQS